MTARSVRRASAHGCREVDVSIKTSDDPEVGVSMDAVIRRRRGAKGG